MLILNLILISNICLCQNVIKESFLIEWSKGALLEWRDFKKEPLEKKSVSAQTTTKHKIKMTGGSSEQIDFEIRTYFAPNKSWVKKESLDNLNLLKHENGHFSIAEIIGRRLRKELYSCSVSSKEKVSELVKEKALKYRKELKVLQASYDKETNHSKDVLNQKKWEEKFLIMLKELDEFSNPKVSIKIHKK